MPFETGFYTIVTAKPEPAKVIGAPPTKPTVRPLEAVAEIGSIQEPIFSFERLVELGPYDLPIYRIRLDDQLLTAEDGNVVVNAAIDPEDASVWIIEARGEGLYGLIQARIGEPIAARAWTLRENIVNEPVSLEDVPQTKSLPPQSLFKDWQLFKIDRADY